MKQLYIDFDGVILDTMTKTYKELEEKGIKCHLRIIGQLTEWKF